MIMDEGMLLSILLQTAYASTPLLLSSTGEILSERAGIVNIGLEGVMLLSGFVGVVVGQETLNPLLGILAGIGTGALVGLIHGMITAYMKGDHTISGLGINLFALGFVPYGIYAVWGVRGYFNPSDQAKVPKVFSVSPIFIASLVLVPLIYYILFKTRFGLSLRACGEDPHSADASGVRVERMQLLASVIGASFSGLAGVFMSLDWLTTITKDLPAGRGFIALAIVNFANWNPLLGLLGSYVFGFSWVAIEWLKISALKQVIPVTLLNTIPYLVTLAVTAGALGRSRPPKYAGVPYKKE
jgi:simple sugar transport system permease protein